MFTVEILLPSKLLFKGEVERVILPGVQGEFGILEGHAPTLAMLGKGKIRVRLATMEERIFEIEGGFVEVNEKRVTVLAKSGF